MYRRFEDKEMPKLLTRIGGLPSPRLAGPHEEDNVPDRLLVDGSTPSWKQATYRFTKFVEWLEQESVTAHRALDFETFTKKWASAAWSELYRVDKKACQWAETTILITFSGSYWLDRDSETFMPPLTYVKNLQSSKQARQKALSRALDHIPKWRSVRCIGGDGHNGYPRIFLGLYLSQPVSHSTFEPVIKSHVDNCMIAGTEGHNWASAVDIRKSPEHKSNLIHTLGQKIPGLESHEGISSESWEKQKIATVLHAGQWRPYSFGSSF